MGRARKSELNVRVDDEEGSITVIDDPFVLADELSTSPSPSPSSRKSLQVIKGPPPKPTTEEQHSKFNILLAFVEAERKALQLLCCLVARRSELLSELTVRKRFHGALSSVEGERGIDEEG